MLIESQYCYIMNKWINLDPNEIILILTRNTIWRNKFPLFTFISLDTAQVYNKIIYFYERLDILCLYIIAASKDDHDSYLGNKIYLEQHLPST